MSTETLVPIPVDRSVMSGAAVKARLDMILDIAEHAMKEGIDYGKVPGTEKPSLWQPGADKLCVAFQIAPKVSRIEPVGLTSDEKAYRVVVSGIHQASGVELGEGAGECSSSEEKYAWRYAVHKNEWDAVPEDRRRLKFKRDGGTIMQVRTNPADVANTVLKMAIKRAKIAMVLAVTGAAAVFTQDIEDLAEELREQLGGDEAGKRAATVQPPQRKSEATKKADERKAAPAADAYATTPSIVAAVQQPEGKKFWVIKLKDDDRFFTTFDEKVARAAEAVVHTDTRVRLTFVEKAAGEKRYQNVTAVTVVAPEPAATAPAASEPELSADDIDFGQHGQQS